MLYTITRIYIEVNPIILSIALKYIYDSYY